MWLLLSCVAKTVVSATAQKELVCLLGAVLQPAHEGHEHLGLWQGESQQCDFHHLNGKKIACMSNNFFYEHI